MVKTDLSSEIEQTQAEFSDLVIKINGLPDHYRDEISADLEKIYHHLSDLADRSTVSVEPGQDARNAASADQQREAERPAEAGLAYYDERFRHLFESLAGVFYYEWDLQTGKITHSGGFEQMLGNIAGTAGDDARWLAQMKKVDRKKIEPELREVKQGKRDVYELEYHVRHANGKWVLLWDRGVIERDGQGKALRVVGILEDVTLLKHQENVLHLANQAMAYSNIVLRRKEERLSAVLANSPVAFFHTDLDLRYIWLYNPMLDLPPEQYIGKRDDEIFSPEDAAMLMAIKQTALDYQITVRREITVTSNEQQRVLFISVQPRVEKGRAITGVVGVCYDLTEKRNLENQVAEKAFQLELSRRLMEHSDENVQKIGKLIQEGPIQGLSSLGFAIQLARQLYPTPEALQVLTEIREGVKNLVIELREVSNELRPPGLEQLGLERAVQSYVTDFKIKNPGLQIELSLPDSPTYLPENTVQGIYHILIESLNNIARHSRASSVKIHLRTEAHQVLLEIKDNGRGFQPDADWMRLTRQGCYGLLRMKDCAESVGGALYVKSAPGDGTTIYVELPLAEAVGA